MALVASIVDNIVNVFCYDGLLNCNKIIRAFFVSSGGLYNFIWLIGKKNNFFYEKKIIRNRCCHWSILAAFY